MCGCAWNMKVVRVWLCLEHEGNTCVAIRVYVCGYRKAMLGTRG